MKSYLFFLLFLSTSVSATQFNTGYGQIIHIRSYGELNPNMPTYIQVEGTAVRPECASGNWGTGYGNLNYYAIMPSEQHLLSIALAAHMSGKQVRVTSNYTDSLKYNNEVCRVVYLDVKP